MLLKGDRSGLEQLFLKYYDLLTRLSFYFTGDRTVAEDLTQDLFIAIWQRRETIDRVDNLKSYLTVAIKNRSLDFIGDKRQQKFRFEQYLEYTAADTEPYDGEEQLLTKVLNGLQLLPSKCRLIFSLSRFEGLTNSEIADYLEITKRTVETQISKALRLLRENLHPD